MAIADWAGDFALNKKRPSQTGMIPPAVQAPQSALANAVMNTAPVVQQPVQRGGLSGWDPMVEPYPQATPSVPVPALAQGIIAKPAAAPVAVPARVDSGYGQTGIGTGSNAIVGRVGANGRAEFTQAGNPSLANMDIAPKVQAPNTPLNDEQLASIGGGSASNIGNGLGNLSIVQGGQEAMLRNLRAADIARATRLENGGGLVAGILNPADYGNSVAKRDRAAARMDAPAGGQAAIAARVAAASSGAGGLANSILGQQLEQQKAQLSLQSMLNGQQLLQAARDPNATPEQREAAERAYVLQTKPEALKNLSVTPREQAQIELDKARLTALQNKEANTAEDREKAKSGAMASFDQALSSIDELAGVEGDPSRPEHPGLEKAVGLPGLWVPSSPGGSLPVTPGTDAANFAARLDTLKAQTFLPQVQYLKGAGALSDAEGKKLSDSIGALDRRMSPDEFRKSLKEIRSTLQTARARAGGKGNASGSAAGQTQPGNGLTKEQVDALPSGSTFVGPDGVLRRKP